MRLLIINPNTSKGVTDRIREAANAAAQPGDCFTTVRPTFGPELIVTPDDADHASRAVLETVKAYDAPCDGIVLASFGNTGAEEVRALRPDIPVIGIATAAFSIVAALGGPFGIVTFGQSLVTGLQTKAEEAGLGAKLIGTAAVRTDDFGDPGTVQNRFSEELRQLCEDMHRRGATCVVMGGGPLAGIAAKIGPHCPVPLIDGTQGAITILRTAAMSRLGGRPTF
ncbi:MAG: aspartate/glutamate racemase family protein [Paracoccaceae bacterium]|nr:aspartate/glutamate racemase family protein [Paracoccaceae bacterium]